MAVRPVHVLLISFILNEHASGDYCRNEGNSTTSIPFCQSGTISGLKLYINGSSVQTEEDLRDKGCVCYVKQSGDSPILVDAGGSCVKCGLEVRVQNEPSRHKYYARHTNECESIVLKDKMFTMTMGLDGSAPSINTAFCITIQEHNPDGVRNGLTLTCEDFVTRFSTSNSTISNIVTDTTKSQSPTEPETSFPQPSTQTTNTAEVHVGITNITHGPKANYTHTVTTIKARKNGEPEFYIQQEILVAAAPSGAGVGIVIVFTVIIVICYKRRIQTRQRLARAPPIVTQSYSLVPATD